MHIRRKRSWELPESAATPESVFADRRRLIKGIAAGSIVLAAGGMMTRRGRAAVAADPSAKLYPFKRNDAYKLDRAITPEDLTTSYNNFYEFGSSKDIKDDAQALPLRPWTVAIDGMVEQPATIGIDDLLARMPLEERLYRHRCVEAWSYVVPWTGFPLSKLVDLAKPTSAAQYLQMQTFNEASMAPGQLAFYYPWPYTEGLTMAEATNDLAFLVTGAYGKPVPNVMGAPLRLHLPWKYGFKSVKSIVKFSFVKDRPMTFWQVTGPTEYGFWANVNPAVPHPRWSQQMERDLGTGNLIPTKLFNGYADYVASIYTNLKNEKLWM